MAKNNFDYSIDIMNKMKNLLFPDIMSIIKRKIKIKNIEYHNYSEKRDLMLPVLIKIIGETVIANEMRISGRQWAILFYAINDKLMLAVREFDSGMVFKYYVNDLPDEQFNDIISYLHDITAEIENKTVLNQPTNHFENPNQHE